VGTSCGLNDASDGTTSPVYITINGVPFNQDSADQNKIKFEIRSKSSVLRESSAGIIKVDTVPPGINYNGGTYYGPYSSDPGNTVDVDFSDAGSGLKKVEYRYPNNNSAWMPLWDNLGGASSKTDNFDLWDTAFIGNNLVEFRVTDMVDNVKTDAQLYYDVRGTNGALTLYQGVNLISLRVKMMCFRAFDLGKDIKAKTGKIPFEVMQWDADAQTWVSAISSDGDTWYGTNFDLFPGKAYVVKIRGSGSWPVTYPMWGKAITSAVVVSVYQGITFFSIPYSTHNYKAWDDDGSGGFYGVSNETEFQNPGKQVYEVSWWNSTRGAWETCSYDVGKWSCPDSPGNNFQILPGIGYMMKTRGAGTWPVTFNPG
jgi:hypothetical protein